MATKLLRTVRRELMRPIFGKTIIVELEAGDLISFREKRKRTRSTIHLQKVYQYSKMQQIIDNYYTDLKRYKERKAAGLKAKRPTKPTLSVFSKHLRDTYNMTK